MWGFGVTRRRLRFVSDWTLPSSRLFVSPFESSASHLSLGPPFSRHHLSRRLRPTVKHFAGKKRAKPRRLRIQPTLRPKSGRGRGQSRAKCRLRSFDVFYFFFVHTFKSRDST